MIWFWPLAMAAGAVFYGSGAVVALFRGYAVALERHWHRDANPLAYWGVIALQAIVAAILGYIAFIMTVSVAG